MTIFLGDICIQQKQNWFHLKSEWQKNSIIFHTVWTQVSWYTSDQIIIEPRIRSVLKNQWICMMMISFPIKLTLEPFIIVFIFVWYIQLGIQINRNLVMWKICHIELNYSKPICENLSAEENSQVQSIVQIRTNNFEMVRIFLHSVNQICMTF